MSANRLLGIGGHLTAGKDAVADYLVEKHGWTKLNMSDPLRIAMRKLDPIVPDVPPECFDPEYEGPTWDHPAHISYSEYEDQYGYTDAKKNKEVRRLFQKFGTDVAREMFGDNVWVDYATKAINLHRSAGESVVITGIRFPNEVTMIRGNQQSGPLGVLAWIERPGLVVKGDQHKSEALTSDFFDIVIMNDGTLKDLYAKIDVRLFG